MSILVFSLKMNSLDLNNNIKQFVAASAGRQVLEAFFIFVNLNSKLLHVTNFDS